MRSTPRATGARQEKKPPSKSTKLANGAILGTGALLVLGLGAAILQSQNAQARNADLATNYSPSAVIAQEQAKDDPRDTVLFIGDSYTHGTGAEDDDRWTTLVANEMDWREVNRGRGGTGYATTSGTEGCGLRYCPTYKGNVEDSANVDAEIVVIAGGQNDFSKYSEDSDSVTDSIEATYREVEETFPEARIVAVGPSTPTDVDNVVKGMEAAIQAAASEIDAEYISLIDPNVISEGMALEDGGHVGPDGHAAIADRVLENIKS